MPDDFKIPPSRRTDEKALRDAIRTIGSILSSHGDAGTGARFAVPGKTVKVMADLATNAWKAKTKMIDSSSGEARDEMKRVYRHIEAMFENFKEIGLEIKDHTGDAFDYGLPLAVVAAQPTQGISTERVIETLKPTIYWQERMIQMGEVIIATPSSIGKPYE
jgi:hypothetical protein